MKGFFGVGVAGFEPATSWSQTRRDNRATLHPGSVCCGGEGGIRTLGTRFQVRQFSKLLLSASQAPLLLHFWKKCCKYSITKSTNPKPI